MKKIIVIYFVMASRILIANDTIPAFDSLYILWTNDAIDRLSQQNCLCDSARVFQPIMQIIAMNWGKPPGEMRVYMIGNYWSTRLSHFTSCKPSPEERAYAQLMFDIAEVDARRLRKFLNENNLTFEYDMIEMNILIRDYNARLVERQNYYLKKRVKRYDSNYAKRVRRKVDADLKELALYAYPFYYLDRQEYRDQVLPTLLEELLTE